jgi:hypothetical protein
MARTVISSALELAGLALLAFGFWLRSPWLGFVAGGIGLVLLGVAAGVPGPPRRAGEP